MTRVLASLVLFCVPMVSSAQATEADQAAACFKRVLNRYCLNGPAGRLPTDFDGNSSTVVHYPIDAETKDYVHVENGVVKGVTRVRKNPTMLMFRTMESELVGLYGQPKDYSYLPRYARGDDQATSTAVRLKEAEIAKIWKQPRFAVGLTWDGPDSLKLDYYMDREPGTRVKRNPNGY